MSWCELLKGGYVVPKLEKLMGWDNKSRVEYPEHVNNHEVDE